MNKLSIIVIFFISYTTYAQVWVDKQCPIEKHITSLDVEESNERDILAIVINQEGKVLVNEKDLSYLSDVKFKEFVYTFITNPDESKSRASNPKKATFQINHYNHPEEYNTYLTYIREVYYFIWNSQAQEKYSLTYNELTCEQRAKLQKGTPYRVFEVVKKTEEKKEKGPRFLGPPAFSGDVKD